MTGPGDMFIRSLRRIERYQTFYIFGDNQCFGRKCVILDIIYNNNNNDLSYVIKCKILARVISNITMH